MIHLSACNNSLKCTTLMTMMDSHEPFIARKKEKKKTSLAKINMLCAGLISDCCFCWQIEVATVDK